MNWGLLNGARFRRIDPLPVAEWLPAFARWVIVGDIVDTRLGSQRGDRRDDCVIDVNDCHHTVGLNT